MKSLLLLVYLLLAGLYAGCILNFVLLAVRFKGRITRMGLSSFLGAGLVVLNLSTYYFSGGPVASSPWFAALRLVALLVLVVCTYFWNAPLFRFFSLRAFPLGAWMTAVALGLSVGFHAVFLGIFPSQDVAGLGTALYSIAFSANLIFSMGIHSFVLVTRPNDPRTRSIRREVGGVVAFGLTAMSLVAAFSSGPTPAVPPYLVYDFTIGIPFASYGVLYLGHLFVKATRSGWETYYDLLKMLHYFTPQEALLVDRVLAGESNKTIAFELGLAEDTIKKRLGKILKRLKITSRPQLIKLLRSH